MNPIETLQDLSGPVEKKACDKGEKHREIKKLLPGLLRDFREGIGLLDVFLRAGLTEKFGCSQLKIPFREAKFFSV